MARSPTPLIDGIATAMRHLTTRQRVISQNIANSDTPGFKSRDVAAPDFSALVDGLEKQGKPGVVRPQVRISDRMAALGAHGQHGFATIADPDVTETKPDGNNVTLEDQALKMSEIQSDYATLSGLYRKNMGLLKTALGKGGQ